jgi:hypothetical protein
MGNVLGDVVVDNASTHLCDAIQYGATGKFQLDEDYSVVIATPPLGPVHEAPKDWRNDEFTPKTESWARTVVGPQRDY